MAPTLPIVARAAGRMVARRAFSSSSSPNPSPVGQKFFELDEVERAKIMRWLHNKDAELKMEVDKRIDLVKAAYGDEEPCLAHWLCNVCGVPKGDFRDMLAQRCFIGGAFLTAAAVGRYWFKHELRKWEMVTSGAGRTDGVV